MQRLGLATHHAAASSRRSASAQRQSVRVHGLGQRALCALLAAALVFTPVKVSVEGIAGVRLVLNTASAAPIADPAAPIQFRPTVTQTTGTATPVLVVNLTAPNAAGASLNQYQQFNIDPIGLILNNSLIAGGSLLGGNVAANPNLSGRTATVIINEVTGRGSAAASQLNGALEVFGVPAVVVIANPNGITCGACAFVNTAHITLTTGTPQFLTAPGGVTTSFERATALAYDVRGGHLQIDGTGIEGTVGRVDAIAETIGVSAPIRAGEQINLIAGVQRVAEAPAGQGAHGSDYQLSANGAPRRIPRPRPSRSTRAPSGRCKRDRSR
jgi:filamentous hemagglutinin